MAHFTKYWLFLGWFQVMSVVSWLVSGSFRWFQDVPGCFSFQQVHRRSYKKQCIGQQGPTLEILLAEEKWENNVTTAMLNMKIMDPKGTNYTKNLSITPYNFELHKFLLPL